MVSPFFFFNDTATTEIYTLSLHDALPISHIQVQNWTPFIPPNTGKVGEFGWTGIVAGAGVMFYAYLGFDALTTAAQEDRKSTRLNSSHANISYAVFFL